MQAGAFYTWLDYSLQQALAKQPGTASHMGTDASDTCGAAPIAAAGNSLLVSDTRLYTSGWSTTAADDAASDVRCRVGIPTTSVCTDVCAPCAFAAPTTCRSGSHCISDSDHISNSDCSSVTDRSSVTASALEAMVLACPMLLARSGSTSASSLPAQHEDFDHATGPPMVPLGYSVPCSQGGNICSTTACQPQHCRAAVHSYGDMRHNSQGKCTKLGQGRLPAGKQPSLVRMGSSIHPTAMTRSSKVKALARRTPTRPPSLVGTQASDAHSHLDTQPDAAMQQSFGIGMNHQADHAARQPSHSSAIPPRQSTFEQSCAACDEVQDGCSASSHSTATTRSMISGSKDHAHVKCLPCFSTEGSCAVVTSSVTQLQADALTHRQQPSKHVAASGTATPVSVEARSVRRSLWAQPAAHVS